jgi:mannose-6-phosphate isomerase-like protein (cupin superfamily)
VRDKGFGDTFERFSKTTGIKWLIITVTGWFNTNCGCEYRRKLLNKWFPYKQKQNNKNMKITLDNILDPINPKIFFMEYWNKKHLILRRNKFKSLYTWADFDKYLNQYPGIKGLQIVNQHPDHEKWCLDKVRTGKLKLPMLSKQEVYDEWNKGKTFVIPFAEYQKKELVDICFEFEKYFEAGQANVYCSPKAESKSFPAHSDNTENFLFHTEGKVKWKIYKEFAPNKPKEILDEFILEAGDLLYIPQYQYHEVETIGPRILISVHFRNKPKQSLDHFKITPMEKNRRKKWYNWIPERPFDKTGKRIEGPIRQKPW